MEYIPSNFYCTLIFSCAVNTQNIGKLDTNRKNRMFLNNQMVGVPVFSVLNDDTNIGADRSVIIISIEIWILDNKFIWTGEKGIDNKTSSDILSWEAQFLFE